VDAIDGMDGNGPIQGKMHHVGAILAGTDLAAVDITCCRIMRIEPSKIDYLRRVDKAGPIVQAGESIASVATEFDLIPELRGLRLPTA
jgi:uncharacterized protein (DUF362 family)